MAQMMITVLATLCVASAAQNEPCVDDACLDQTGSDVGSFIQRSFLQVGHSSAVNSKAPTANELLCNATAVKHVEGFKTYNAQMLADTFTDTAYMQFGFGDPVIGKPALKSYFKSFFQTSFNSDLLGNTDVQAIITKCPTEDSCFSLASFTASSCTFVWQVNTLSFRFKVEDGECLIYEETGDNMDCPDCVLPACPDTSLIESETAAASLAQGQSVSSKASEEVKAPCDENDPKESPEVKLCNATAVAHVQGFQTFNATLLANTFAADAYMQYGTGDPVVGKPALYDYFDGFFKDTFNTQYAGNTKVQNIMTVCPEGEKCFSLLAFTATACSFYWQFNTLTLFYEIKDGECLISEETGLNLECTNCPLAACP